MKHVWIVILAVFMTALLTSADAAVGEHPVTVLDQPDSPLRIAATRSRYIDARGYVTSNGFYWNVKSRVRHVGDKPIVAYELEWVLFNAFDEEVDRFVTADNGPFAAEGKFILHAGFPQFVTGDEIVPGGVLGEGWKKPNLHGGTGVRATVRVRRVRFVDGTVWAAQN